MTRYFPGSTTGDKCQQPNSKNQNKEFTFVKWIFSKKVQVQIYWDENLVKIKWWGFEGDVFGYVFSTVM